MGSALSSQHRVKSERDGGSAHWVLLVEYTAHSIKSLDECAAIFFGGSAGNSDDDGHHNHHRSSRPVVSFSSTSYPRFLTFDQFEEIFGMLVADAEPHFDFFLHALSSSRRRDETVCAHLVFCALALLARADLHSKVRFLLRLYAVDAHGQLPTERKRLLVSDFLAALPHVLSLSEPFEHEIVSYLEKTLVTSEDKSGTTSREFYDFCFTTARVTGFLHDVQSTTSELRKFLEKRATHGRSQHSAAHQEESATTGQAGGVSRPKLLNRGATMLQLTTESLFWSMRARDLSWFWRQEHIKLEQNTTVSDALRVMKSHNTPLLLVVGSTPVDYVGCLTIDDFQAFLAGLLPDDATCTTTNDFMRLQVAKACQICSDATLRTVVSHAASAAAGVNGSGSFLKPRSTHSGDGQSSLASCYQCVAADECWFNVVLRLACGATSAAAVLTHMATGPLQEMRQQPHQELPDEMIDPLLGRISLFDVLEWLLGDLSLLNGKEKFAVSSFPWFYCSPVCLALPTTTNGNSKRPSLLDALMMMRTHKTTGVLVHDPSQTTKYHIISPQSLLEVYNPAHPLDVLSPLRDLLDTQSLALESCYFVESEHSIAHVVHTMVTHHTRRVCIHDQNAAIQGVIRATDVLRLLLREQHHNPRLV